MSWVRRALAGLAVLVGGAALAGAVLAWWLSHGGIDLAFLLPAIERTLARPAMGLTVRIGSAALEWDRVERRPALLARDVRLLGADGGMLAVLPAIAVQPSVSALLERRLAVQSITVVGARLRIVRTPDGGIDLGLADGQHTGGGELLSRMRSGSTSDAATAELERIELRDGEILVTDAATGATWRMTGVALAVARGSADIAATLTADADLGASPAPLRLDAVYRPDPPGAAATLWFDRVVPAAAASLASSEAARAALARFDLPIGGTLHLDLDGDLRPRTVHLDAGSGSGSIALPELPMATVAVRRIALSTTVDVTSDTLQVESLALDLANTHVTAHGSVRALRDARRVELDAAVDRLPVSDLERWWPRDAALPARAWVTTRITRGTVRAARVHLTGSAAEGGLVPDAVTTSARFDGLAVRYLDTMPTARGIAGTMTMAEGTWRFHLARGGVEDLDVAHGSVAIDGKAARARVDVAVRGPVATALRLAARTGRAGDLGLDPGRAGGVMTGDARFDIPLARTVRQKDGVGLSVSARAEDASLKEAFRRSSFSDGELAVDLRDGALHVTGTGRLEGAPITVDWNEDATTEGRRRRRVDVAGRLDTAARAAIGFDLRPWVDGPIDTRVQLVHQDGDGTLDVSADLTGASLDVAVLGIAKPPAAPARADARLTIARDVVTTVERFALVAGGSSMTGRATLAAGRVLHTLDLAATIPGREPGAQAGHLTVALTPATSGSRFVVTSDDAGALFRAIGKETDASGGHLRYAGTLDLNAPGNTIDGRIEIRDFTLRRAPALARVATLSSLSGIAGALQGGGIRFDRLEANIGARGATITITDGVLRGPSLAILAAGTVDRSSGIGDLRGTLVPSYYGLNTAPARIPVVGSILAGKGGEGVHAIDFTIIGPTDAPRVTVSPVSSIAPGVLRDLTRKLGNGDR